MPVVEANSKSAGLFGVRRGGGSDVHRRGETRRHLSTGQRAMASALVLADAGRREGGRWVGWSRELSTQVDSSAGWQNALWRAGLILDFAPELASAVVAGEATLNAARRAQSVADDQSHTGDVPTRLGATWPAW